MDGSWLTSIASIIVALIALGSGGLARRASAKAARENKLATSRATIEEEAFERAEGLLNRQFGRQETEIAGLIEDVARLENKRREFEQQREADRRQHEADQHEIAVLLERVRVLSAALAARGET